jgi:hypothetical protein
MMHITAVQIVGGQHDAGSQRFLTIWKLGSNSEGRWPGMVWHSVGFRWDWNASGPNPASHHRVAAAEMRSVRENGAKAPGSGYHVRLVPTELDSHESRKRSQLSHRALSYYIPGSWEGVPQLARSLCEAREPLVIESDKIHRGKAWSLKVQEDHAATW